MASLESRIHDEAAALGFAACGFARADAADAAGEELRGFIAEGRHGEMGWMEERLHHRVGVKALWPEARSVIALGLSYAPARDPRWLEAEPTRGRISVYAQGADYHKLVKQKLKALARWLVAEAPCEVKVFVDTAPVMEKPLAAAAGLGWQGKHTNLLSRSHGNWLFLGIIYTTLELEPSAPASAHCGSCTACIAACPTGAITAPHRIDARKCISYLTIEHPGPIPEAYRTAMGNRIYGCDDCLAACPWNRFAGAEQGHEKFRPRPELVAPQLADLLQLDDAGFRELFAGSPIKRIGRGRLVRNCLIAAGNSGDRALAPQVERLTRDPDPVVADAARWARERLR
ncbi:tRNA epoxyqueuosine(34) reductase QueG [Sphingomicrobium astaxanthinifaciens]|uniref:tRNA epoxyqueuosine(34) reductase QueG n=1 Tax=Sphingomicrobium astaxanthinifaciens TaxID=1227949 RepID=UPI001FCB063D|nr:tRNA epoxyqueuosine(34) reductase QueG [Sphingomicrobium astaxanthinifaciens]MCJ7420972.1 tRNA epoxyqueuosine(34) reductase QueG [Sphingomicrobium astaxanthinifaciens]